MAFASFRKLNGFILIQRAAAGNKTITKSSIMCAQRNFSSELVSSITVSPSTNVYSQDLAKISPGIFKIPPKPLKLTVQYADTALGRPSDKFHKTIVAIHGTPGYFTHFDTFVEHFKNTNIRFIAPNLPDFAHTRETNYFWHTTPERVSFVKQFLRDIGVTEIDCLVSHSFGAQCISALWNDPEEFIIRSVCFFAPQPMFDRSKKNARKKASRLFIFNQPWWYWFLEKAGIHNSDHVPMKMASLNEFLLLCSLIYDRTPYTFSDRLEKLIKATDIPITLVYGDKERLISKDAIAKFNEILGLSPEQIVHLDPEIKEDQVPFTGKRINSYLIKSGGHFAHTNHFRFSNQIIDNLLKQISK